MPEPPSVRDFYAFERHVAAGARLRGREIAAALVRGAGLLLLQPGVDPRPGRAAAAPGGDVASSTSSSRSRPSSAAARASSRIAGFTLMNDWSARDVQAREVTVGLGPRKAKDFGTSLGPWLVTPDELPYEDGRLRLEARVLVNGERADRAPTPPSSTSPGRRSSPTRPATRGCDRATCSARARSRAAACSSSARSPTAARRGRWIEPGDVVALEADGLGRLETPIV